MTAFDDLTWHKAMRQGHTALIESESLDDDINASEGRSNLDIEKHLRRAEAKATQGPERGRAMLAWPRAPNPSASGTSTPSRSRPTVATRPPVARTPLQPSPIWAACSDIRAGSGQRPHPLPWPGRGSRFTSQTRRSSLSLAADASVGAGVDRYLHDHGGRDKHP
jgi:hypothetical protein